MNITRTASRGDQQYMREKGWKRDLMRGKEKCYRRERKETRT
jgi:hypothetical protein